jgi:hypothetical protein
MVSSFWTPALALARLSFRRALGTAFLAWCGVLFLLLALRDWAPPAAWIGGRGSAEAATLASGLVRQGVWGGVTVAILPFLVMRAARTIGAWRAGEVEWLASRAASRSTILWGTWAGHCAAAWFILIAAGVVAEFRAGRSGPSLELSGRIGDEGSGWIEGRHAFVWRARDPGAVAREGSRARFELALGSSSGAGGRVILSARRTSDRATEQASPRADDRDGEHTDDRRGTLSNKHSGAHSADRNETLTDARDGTLTEARNGRLTEKGDGTATVERDDTRVEKRIGTRSDIEIELPRGPGDIEFALACGSEGERVFLLSQRGELWIPVESGRSASSALLARDAASVAVWLALAIGFGGWMSAASATALILALMIPAWMSVEPSAVWPGGDLFGALAIVGGGRVPSAIDARSIACAALLVVAGIGLARWSIVQWRREP